MANPSTWTDKFFGGDGPTGPTGPTGPAGSTGPTGPAGSAGQNNVALSNGLNSNVATSGQSTVRVTGPTAAFAVGGFVAAAAGASLSLVNTTSQAMTLVHEDAGSTAANRINCQSNGVNVVIPPLQRAVTFVYDGTSSRWVLQNAGLYAPRDVTAREAGAVGDGVADDSAALLAAATAGFGLHLPAGTYRVSTTTTLPSTSHVTFAAGAQISVDAGKTLTIQGPLKAAPSQYLFPGLGTVLLPNEPVVHAVWFGAGVVSDLAIALNAADTALSAGRGHIEVRCGGGTLLSQHTLTTGHTLKLGKGTYAANFSGSGVANGTYGAPFRHQDNCVIEGDGDGTILQENVGLYNPQAVSGAADNGSGLVRLTFSVAQSWTTGVVIQPQGVWSGIDNLAWTVTKIDTTHFDLQGSSSTGIVWSGGGNASNLSASIIIIHDQVCVNPSAAGFGGYTIRNLRLQGMAQSLKGGALSTITTGNARDVHLEHLHWADTAVNAASFGTSGSSSPALLRSHAYNKGDCVIDPVLAITAATNVTATITAATAARPIVCTSTAHPFATGQQINIVGATGMTQLNTGGGSTQPKFWTVTKIDANTFSLNNADGQGASALTNTPTASCVKVTCNGHGLSTGNVISIVGMGGITTPNAEPWPCFRVDSNNVTVPAQGTGTYTSGGTIQQIGSLYYVALSAGTTQSGAVTLPKNLNATVVDGGVTWQAWGFGFGAGCQHIFVDRCTVENNFAQGLNLINGYDCHVRGCSFVSKGISQGSSPTMCDFEVNLDTDQSLLFEITGNTFDCRSSPAAQSGSITCVSVHSGNGNGQACHGLGVIANNVMLGVEPGGLNTSTGLSVGVNVQNCTGVKVSDNVIHRAASASIVLQLASTRCVIENNMCVGSGILLGGVVNNIVSANRILIADTGFSARAGVLEETTANIYCSGNKITHGKYEAFGATNPEVSTQGFSIVVDADVGGCIASSGAGRALSVREITGSYTALATDHVIRADATGGNLVITIPAAAYPVQGGAIHPVRQELLVKRIDASANTVTFALAAGTDTYDGGTAGTAPGGLTARGTSGDHLRILADGVGNWDNIT